VETPTCTAGQAFTGMRIDLDINISMDIHEKSVDIDMDVKYHIHGNPGYRPIYVRSGLTGIK
jgi:hypothetical protein